MSNMFFKAKGFTSSRSGLTQLSNVESLVPLTYEKTSYDHWIFNKNSLVGGVNNKTLVQQAGATISPIFSSNGVTLSTEAGNALLSDFIDGTTDRYTMSALITIPAFQSGITNVLGNLPNGGIGSGAGIYFSEGAFRTNTRVTTTGYVFSPANGTAGTTFEANKPIFISYSIDKTAKKINVYAKQDKIEFSGSVGFTDDYISNANAIAIGNSLLGSSNRISVKYHEAIIFAKALTINELKALALRSESRYKLL